MSELFVSKPPSGLDTVGGYPALPALPKEWYGWALRWEPGYSPKPVFIGQVPSCPKKTVRLEPSGKDISLWAFGFRVALAKASCKTAELPAGNFIEYVVVSREATSPPQMHHLRQTESVTYAETSLAGDYLPAVEVKPATALHLDNLPRWKAEAATWPTHKGKAMMFICQWSLPKNAVTSKHLAYDMSIFLFAAKDGKELSFSITTQDSNIQTASEHYATEE